MDDDRDTPETAKTLGAHVRKALRETNAWRPASFYLLFAIPIVMILAAPTFYFRDEPKRFALHLALLFVFLFVIMVRAVIDWFEITRRHRAEGRKALLDMLGQSSRPPQSGGDPPPDQRQ